MPDHNSMGHTQEILGFLCRWVLLGGAALASLAVGAAGVGATAALSDGVHSELFLRDGLAPAGADRTSPVYLQGELRPPIRPDGQEIALLAADGHALACVRAAGQRCEGRLEGPREGLTQVVARGLPYGPMAFRAQRCLLLGVPEARRLFLLDARLALAVAAERPDEYRRCAGAIRAHGEVALFHPGPPGAFHDALRRLRRAGVGEPVLFDDRQAPPRALARMAAAIGRWPSPRGVEVVTGEADLARQAAAAGFPTHLIAPPGPLPPSPSAGLLRRHESLAKFKDSLAPGPIP